MIKHHQIHERVVRLLSEEACQPTPSDTERKRMEELTDYARRHLTPLTRQIFRMRFLDEMKVLDIAAQMGISRQTVHAHLRQAIEGIRKKYEKK
jgi:RNA polymerase sigma factor (sigma-70 family)